MPLHVARLRDSDLASEVDPEACWYAVLLWAASWHQIPAGSLPDNEAVLTKLIGLGRDVKTFRRHRAGALRGFVLCSDGRLYHPVVAEQANAAWSEKLAYRDRREVRVAAAKAAAAARWGNAGEAPDGLPSVPDRNANAVRDASDTDAQRMADALPKGTGTGTGTKEESSVPDGTGGEPPDPVIAELEGLAVNVRSWRLAKLVLTERGGLSTKQASDLVAKWVNKDGLPVEELWQIAVATWRHGTDQPADYMGGAVRRALAQSGADILMPSPERQRAWMRDFVESPASWSGNRGPRPGEMGCRVFPGILSEFGFGSAPAGRSAA